ncbi:hypothetical protein D3C75_921390 [compost metagenome]
MIKVDHHRTCREGLQAFEWLGYPADQQTAFIARDLVGLRSVRLESACHLDLVHAVQGDRYRLGLVQSGHLDAVGLEPGDDLAPLAGHDVLLRTLGHQVRLGIAGHRNCQLLGFVAPDNGLGTGDR